MNAFRMQLRTVSLFSNGLRRNLASSTKSSTSVTPQMPWNEFFALRKQRRVLNSLTSTGTTAMATMIAYQYFAHQEIDFNKTFAGIEIQWIYIGGILSSGVFGWLVGPTVGDKLFNLKLGRNRQVFNEMDGLFLQHVAKNRPDPSRNNVNFNPLNDYYGEKIGSISDYRQWLRKNHLFTKKAENFFNLNDTK